MDVHMKRVHEGICSECGKIFLSFFFYLLFQIFNFVITYLTFGSFISILCFKIFLKIQTNVRFVILISILDWFVFSSRTAFWTVLKVTFIWNMNKLIGIIWNNDMDVHMKRVHEGKCSECGKIFLSYFFYCILDSFKSNIHLK